MGSLGPTGPTDRTPDLDQLLRAENLTRALTPFVHKTFDAICLFDREGAQYAGAEREESPLVSWEQLPAEAQDAALKGGSFGFGKHVFEVRPVYAGADRVGVLVFSSRASADSDDRTRLAGALTGMVGQLLQSGFATWVTSELHLAASESSYLAVQQQNAELQRAVEHLRELDKLKSNFLATVSHELRTPLTSVIGFSEMLLEGLAGDLNGEQREYVQTIFDRGEELLNLITQILEMSRMEVGAIRLDLAPLDIAGLARRTLEGLKLNANKAEVTLVADLTEGVLPPVLVDADKVHQILSNLIGNAVKFSRTGGSVHLTATRAPIRRPFEAETLFGEEEADAIRVSVRDTGGGIPAEQLERIFEAFYQVDSSSTREYGGAGLGLSIVKNLVTAHGGEVWAESVVGEGTCFHFTIPLASPEALLE